MRYMLPTPKTKQSFYHDLYCDKPIKKESHVKHAKQSLEYKVYKEERDIAWRKSVDEFEMALAAGTLPELQ